MNMNDNKIKPETITLRQLKATNRRLKKQLRAEQRKLDLMASLASENATLPEKIKSIIKSIKDKERALYQNQ